MFRSLHSRLLFSYITVILICLALVGLGLLLFLRTSPLWARTAFLQLDAAARAAMPALVRRDPQSVLTHEQFVSVLAQVAEEQEVRVLLLDDGLAVRFDSEGEWENERLEEMPRPPVGSGRFQGTFNSPEGRRWAFVGQMIPNQPNQARQTVLFVSPQGRFLIVIWFIENLLPPLVQAGLVSLVISILLAWLVARSVARPLQRVSAAAGGIAQGNLDQRAPVSGPREARDLARAFNRMATQVAATQQAQQDLVANVSHELKTPLTSVQGFSQAILDGTATGSEEVGRAARIIYDEAERMRRMVDDLLGLARFDAGQIEMALEPIDVSQLLERCVERLMPQAKAAGNTLSFSSSETLFVTGDVDWLTQVFVNLLDNSIQHTQAGRVEVTARRVEKWIEIIVVDTGEGIPPQDLDRIFERFYQADKSRPHKGGVGLGLSIAREVIQRHGGEIMAQSVLDLGSRFTVRLPVRPEDRETIPARPQS